MAPNRQTDDTEPDRHDDHRDRDREPEPEQTLTWMQRRRLERQQ